LLENYWERPDEVIAPPRLLDGNELMKELGLKPGPAIGKILEAVREEQAAGTVHSHDDAITCAREWIKENPVLQEK
jgi:poly(A) polymerase